MHWPVSSSCSEYKELTDIVNIVEGSVGHDAPTAMSCAAVSTIKGIPTQSLEVKTVFLQCSYDPAGTRYKKYVKSISMRLSKGDI